MAARMARVKAQRAHALIPTIQVLSKGQKKRLNSSNLHFDKQSTTVYADTAVTESRV